MKPAPIVLILLSPAIPLLLAGCVRDHSYRVAPSVYSVPPDPQYRPDASSVLPVGTHCTAGDGGSALRLTPARDLNGDLVPVSLWPCIAFIEFDDRGKELVPDQTTRATALIAKAIADDPQGQPIVLTFIHGWKHNASAGLPEDTNIQGLEHALDYLYTGFYGGQNCMGATGPCTRVAGHVVIGIYIAWRGEVISHYWPVARTISVYSREATAEKLGPHVSAALDQISNAAHPRSSAGQSNQPMLVFVGHSFGGLVLETAMRKSYIRRLDERKVAADPKTIPTFADLVIYLNSAAPATEAVPILDYMAVNHLQYREDAPGKPPGNGSGRNRPLLVSITTPADFATGTLFPIAFSAKALLKEATGSLKGQQQIACYDPVNHSSMPNPSAPAASEFFTSSAAHMDFLQSHELIDLGPPPTQGAPNTCKKAPSPDVYEYGIPGHCFQIQPKATSASGRLHCNNTPYWIVSTDSNIIPDHGTIFTDRLIRFIGLFLPPPNTNIISPPQLTY